jgi:phosphatidylserine/phosphatidylglycerophosphate/cardiolipin synthase-like enzyme
LGVRFLAEGEQTGPEVAAWLAAFLAHAQRSLDIAIYDFRLRPPLRQIVAGALSARAEAGVAIRIVYDAEKPQPPHLATGMDPAPLGTGAFVRSLGYPFRRIDGLKLMHQKYVIRDAGLPTAGVWTGSTNFTDDSWTVQENNILTCAAPQLTAYYAEDFAELWRWGVLEHTGDFPTHTLALTYGGAPATVYLAFAPGCGAAIDEEVARRVAAAQRRVRICSMLLNSGALINALNDVLTAGQVPVDGIYDRTQMEGVFEQWQQVQHNHWKIPAVRRIIAMARLVGKNSTPYSPASRHDYMHNKVLLVDDTVIAGSYNFSHSAELNAENILMIESSPLSEAFSRYIDHLLSKYGGHVVP